MVEAKITACAKVPKELYETSIQKYTKISIAILAGLELLRDKDSIQNEDISIPKEYSSENQDLLKLQEIRITELQANNQERIEDLRTQIQSLNEQINKKDKLLEELNQTLLAQASNIYNLTQNPKLITENKTKKWWIFWK